MKIALGLIALALSGCTNDSLDVCCPLVGFHHLDERRARLEPEKARE
jgi:hypothetical protein